MGGSGGGTVALVVLLGCYFLLWSRHFGVLEGFPV